MLHHSEGDGSPDYKYVIPSAARDLTLRRAGLQPVRAKSSPTLGRPNA